MGRGLEPGPSRIEGSTALAGQCSFPGGINNNFDPSWNMSQDPTKMNKLREMVENTTSATRKCVIDNILQQIAQLSDLEKFLLYLKLPMGKSPEPDPLKQPLNPLGSRSEVQLTITWIKTHLQEDLDISLFKEDVYRKYLQYSGNYQIKHLSKADFGKVMKQVFPKVKARRLGHRGDSRYTYSGLTNKFSVDRPFLPDLSDCCGTEDKGVKKMPGLSHVSDLEQEKAASTIILEWAEKMGHLKCSTVTELARQLLNKSCVDTNSPSACTLLSEPISSDLSAGKNRLQIKLQEKEQKRKLQQEVTVDTNRNTTDRSKSRKRGPNSKIDPPDDTVGHRNLKNCQSTSLKLNINNNNNLEQLIAPDNDTNIDQIYGVSPIIKKEIFESEQSKNRKNGNKDADLCTFVSATLCADSGKLFPSKGVSVAAGNGVEMKSLVSNLDRNGSSAGSDLANGNVTTGLHCRVEDLPSEIHIIHAEVNDGKSAGHLLDINDRDKFLSPMTCHDDKIDEIRSILTSTIGKPTGQIITEPPLEYEADITPQWLNREVNFQRADGSLVTTATMLGPSSQEQPVQQTGYINLPNFTPLPYYGGSNSVTEHVSHGSSTNPSPFMSPSNTPLPRSRNPSGPPSSYATPRSTFTPDLIGQSENSTPFMSPARTPLLRSRHPSTQGITTAFAAKSWHTTGTARHTPYEDMSRRKTSRNTLSTMPLSAPMSPRDTAYNTLSDLTGHSHIDGVQGVLRKGNVGISGLHGPRYRHWSEGATLRYHQQPLLGTLQAISTDSLSIEVSNTMSSAQPCKELSQSGSSNRPQSVPLLPMSADSVSEANLVAKSHPNTPMCNQQFTFNQEATQSATSFAPKPIANDFVNFPDFVEETAINPSISPLNNPSELANFNQSISNNVSFPEHFQRETASVFARDEEFLQNVGGGSFTSTSMVPNNITCPQRDIILNRNANNTCQQVPTQSQDTGYSGTSQMTLNALNAPPLDLHASLDRGGFDPPSAIQDDYNQPYSSLVEQDEFPFFDTNRD